MFLLLISQLIPLSFGVSVITWLFRKHQLPILEKLSLGYFIGTGFLTMFMFIMSLVGISWRRELIGGILVLCTLLFLYFSKRTKGFSLKSLTIKRFSGFELLCLSVLILNSIVIFYLALNKPVVNWDAWANWSLRAKIFFYDRGISFDPNAFQFLGRGGHINYPLHLSILESWVYLVLGVWNDQLVKIIFPVYFVSFILLLYSVFSSITKRYIALLAVLLWSITPFISYHAIGEYADLPGGIFFCAGLIAGWKFITKKQWQYIVLSSILLSQSAWVKNETFIFSIITIVFFIYKYHKSVNNILLIIAPYLFFLSPWLYIKQQFHLGLSNMASTGNLSSFGFHPEVILTLLEALIRVENFGLLWLISILTIFFYPLIIKKMKLTYFYILAGIFFALYLGIYIFTDNYQFVEKGIILNRNLLIIAPSIYWMVASVVVTLTGKQNTVQ